MTATLTARGFGATRGARTLFDGLDLVVAPGDVWGLTGPNGAGKSTLLHALAGDPVAEMTGQLTLSPPDATVGLLRQEVERDDDEVVRDFLHRVTGVADALERMNALAGQMADSDSAADAYGDALERWLALGGGDLDERIPVTAARLGLDDTVPDLPMSALSGGQAARVNLGAVLLSQYDILLLDEPTNDLDLAGLAVLEDFMQAERRPMVVVSHDREFLARCVTGIVELDSAQQQIAVFDGGYEAYLAERALARQRARDAYEEYAGRVDQLKDRVQTQKSWLDKGVRNTMRKTGGKDAERDKHIRNRAGQRSEKQAAKISQSERAMERLEVVAEPRKEWELQMEIATAPRSGSVVAVLAEAVVRRGDFVLGPVTLQIDAGDRILISGSNGSGKTTLLAAITGERAVDSGRATVGSGVQPGTVDQARTEFGGPDPLLDTFCVAADPAGLDPTEARTLLAKFGLGGEHVARACASLSPGERTRAALALLQQRGVNLLVLDEPTNHLDLPAIEQLEQAVDAFGGTVLLITHDRRMRDAFRATRELLVDAGSVRERH
ncbi:ABC-F family ATP-binding cassette domain-containing protein [Dietzia maris]|jgi:ATPase subunit of ABC transporter with duplicated ATPase domains|uniref:ABC transporter ATP-binding protein n=1 Tax=Dietzia maris TaxID=37915 RepID=A0A365PD82_9ACTN|nr:MULTISPECIES: ABC-F family ATP-binding cassette domain-containing protein [Dietzia]MCZ4539832.1 ABC-F family ATP-binding cassette domain-containing protein [Dietzia maris]MCZ4656689.1 ABC-F family ATP-binding cassette domain-containing protein [Dietzia kunjamensis]MDV3355700.1 ABC-F family ATP-binding cassette domain-containing protein [Dietzia sp. IN118]OAV78718.1 heme ABC transporter ATP-binding protein [Dietzia sp. 111N12-1]RBA40046.1 ABC transporter ATP-binding protein [Dietzia maris]